METTKVALENERKIQQLQMQAINALWKKVSTLQPPPVNAGAIESAASSANLSGLEPNSTAVVQDLAKTCSVLTNQVRKSFKKLYFLFLNQFFVNTKVHEMYFFLF